MQDARAPRPPSSDARKPSYRRKPVGLALALTCVVLVLGLPARQLARAAYPSPAASEKGMVVTSQPDATRAGVRLLEEGGNAVDAAVATALALAVTTPFSAGLGGGAFLLIHRAQTGEVVALDARETAPAAATRDMYVREGVAEDASLRGALAIATPGFARGLALALERYGTKKWAEVLAPAIRLAEEGFAIGPYHARMAEAMRRRILAQDFPETARIQFPLPGREARHDWVLRQPDLAATLRRLAEKGADDLYTGELAARIVATVRERGGILGAEDLAGYEPVVRKPVMGSYRGTRVYSYPPPSSGGVVLLQMLNILEGFDLASRGAGSSASGHVIAEAMKLAFADRAAYLGDPDFVEVPVAMLVSKEYAAEQRSRMAPPWFRRAPWNWFRGERDVDVAGPGLPANDEGTVHLSVTDAAGNAVALTMTINTPYGSGITVPETGIILNNEMDDFSKAPDRPNVYGLVDTRGANAIAPGKRPLSSMSPTILTRNGRVFMVTGSPGGPRIISTTLLSILNVIDYGMDVEAAVSSPRLHHQWVPDELRVEPEVPADVVEGLRDRGHTVEVAERHWSAAEAIVVDPESGLHLGGSDPRRGGLALGPGD